MSTENAPCILRCMHRFVFVGKMFCTVHYMLLKLCCILGWYGDNDYHASHYAKLSYHYVTLTEWLHLCVTWMNSTVHHLSVATPCVTCAPVRHLCVTCALPVLYLWVTTDPPPPWPRWLSWLSTKTQASLDPNIPQEEPKLLWRKRTTGKKGWGCRQRCFSEL